MGKDRSNQVGRILLLRVSCLLFFIDAAYLWDLQTFIIVTQITSSVPPCFPGCLCGVFPESMFPPDGSPACRKSAWGSYHWILIPLPQTNTYQRKRNSFTIHGGNNYDSGGCIDLQKNDVILREYLKNVHQTKMFLFVQYDEKKVIISEEHDNFYPLHP